MIYKAKCLLQSILSFCRIFLLAGDKIKAQEVLHTRRGEGKKSRTTEDQCLDCNGSEVSNGLVSLVTAWPSFVKPGLDGIKLRALRGANGCDCGYPGGKH